MKICLAFSSGGHFTEMQRVMKAFEGHDIFYATTKARSTEVLQNTYYLKNTGGASNLLLFFYMIFISIQSLKIIIKERPNLIISTGADVTIPICFIGRLFRGKVIFIESICRIQDLSPSGKIVYPIANLFLVQWQNLSKKYSKAKYWGSVL